MELFKPANSAILSEMKDEPLMLAIQGAPGVGKTWSAVGFPNPFVINIDNKLNAHKQRSDIGVLNIWDIDIVKAVAKDIGFTGEQIEVRGAFNRSNIILKWLLKFGSQFSPEQTVILDSWTTLMDNSDAYNKETPQISKKTGEEVKYSAWTRKIEYSKLLLQTLKSLKCKKIVIFHEKPERNDDGNLTGAFSVMDGAMKDQLITHFSDWYRQVAVWETIDGKKVLNRYWIIIGDTANIKCLTGNRKLIDAGKVQIPAEYKSLL